MKKLVALILLLSLLVPCASALTKYELDISKDLLRGHEEVSDTGHNEAVGTTEVDIWQGPTNDYPWLITATKINVTSTDVDDTISGTGARVVYLEGLDENYTRINETINMNGQNNATSVNEYLRLNLAQVVLSGTLGGNNEGDIYFGVGPIIAGAQAIAYEFIDADYGRSHVSAWTVPANHTLYLKSTLYTIHIGSSKEVETYLNIRLFGANRTRWRAFEFHSSDVAFTRPFNPPVAISEKTDIFFTSMTDVGTASVSVDFIGILVENRFNSEQVPTDVELVNDDLINSPLLILAGLGVVLSFFFYAGERLLPWFIALIMGFISGMILFGTGFYWLASETLVPVYAWLFIMWGIANLILVGFFIMNVLSESRENPDDDKFYGPT